MTMMQSKGLKQYQADLQAKHAQELAAFQASLEKRSPYAATTDSIRATMERTSALQAKNKEALDQLQVEANHLQVELSSPSPSQPWPLALAAAVGALAGAGLMWLVLGG